MSHSVLTPVTLASALKAWAGLYMEVPPDLPWATIVKSRLLTSRRPISGTFSEDAASTAGSQAPRIALHATILRHMRMAHMAVGSSCASSVGRVAGP
ncbi:hypothetical protein A0H81_07369 [Grifola frondosa]|uniref:Uncharacterized protein n=1 Tax=Grifola frondosa TaxID=5627 RepID=A0A1C7M5Y0_GRIFR|nr:hypothetical protein A0H81_07369 [Grifola frondosa]